MLTDLISLYIAGTLSTNNQALSDTQFIDIDDNKYEIINEINLPVSAVPVKKVQYVNPVVKARAAAIVDLDTGEYLYKKNIDEELQIASITKLMTVIVAMEKGNLSDTVVVSQKAALTIGSKIWLYQDEEISLKNLIYAALIHSGNDAAIAIAEHISGTEEDFVKEMNLMAKKLHLYNTSFQNPVGFDHIDNYSTVEDLVKLGRFAFANPLIQDTVRRSEMTISSVDGDITHDLETTNDALDSFINFIGMKTGSTEKAGLCFVSVAEKDGNKVLTVVLNSPNRFGETKILAAWAYKSILW
jgi:D-alanyl-D-alanine carboxypeptidase (penicillin-binding protein 5/6)